MEEQKKYCCIRQSKAGITAYPLGGQDWATQLFAIVNRVDTAAAVNSSVKLMRAKEERSVVVINNSANDILLYPFPGDNFLSEAVNAPVTIPSEQKISLICMKGEEKIWTIKN